MVLPLLFTIHCLLFTVSCGTGDDDGRRLGELIVGTWQRGWGEGDVVIDGDTELQPRNLAYDYFVFNGDGSYNGMVRKGTFAAYDTFGDLVYDGTYQCDNNNLKLEPSSGEGTILAQVISFTENTILLRYRNEAYDVTVTVVLYSSSSMSAS